MKIIRIIKNKKKIIIRKIIEKIIDEEIREYQKERLVYLERKQ